MLGRAGLAAASLIGVIGAWTILITPGLLAVLASHVALDDQQLGYVAAWNINAIAITIGLSTFLLPRLDWRLCVAAGLALICIGSVATAMGTSYEAIKYARALTGCGEGIAIGFAFAAFGRSRNPDRAFSIYLVAGALSGAIALLYLPNLAEIFGAKTLFLSFAAIALFSAVTLLWFPHGKFAADDPRAQASVKMRLAILALISVFFYFGAISAIWSYAERIGNASGLGPNQIAQGLSFGTFAGMAGAALAGLVPSRLGRIWPLFFAAAVSVISIWMLNGTLAAFTFIAAMILFLFAWNFAQPFLSGACADADAKGRVVCAMGAIQTLGMGFGPAAVASSLGSRDYTPALWGSSVVIALSIALMIIGIRLDIRRAG